MRTDGLNAPVYEIVADRTEPQQRRVNRKGQVTVKRSTHLKLINSLLGDYT